MLIKLGPEFDDPLPDDSSKLDGRLAQIFANTCLMLRRKKFDEARASVKWLNNQRKSMSWPLEHKMKIERCMLLIDAENQYMKEVRYCQMKNIPIPPKVYEVDDNNKIVRPMYQNTTTVEEEVVEEKVPEINVGQ